MTGPATPGQEGPSYGPPSLPEGWIAQWDGMSRKYYFVQLSTGTSQWDTPTHAAPTGPTPQATPQGVEHPYGTPAGGEGQIITNQDGSQSIRHPDGRVEPLPADGDRGLGGDIGKFAMNQLLGGGKKQNHGSSNQSGLMSIAGQFLGSGGKHNSSGGGSSSSSAGGIVGALAGSLLGSGKKTDNQQQTNYSGAQTPSQGHGGGFMESVGGMFGGGHHQGSSQQGNNFGYSQQTNQQGSYTGAPPPTSYQPGGQAHTAYNPPPQHGTPQHGAPPQSYPQNQPHSQPYDGHSSSYGANTYPQQPAYGASPQPPYSPPYGGIQHQDSYGNGAPPQSQHQQYGGTPSYGQPGGPQYGAPPNSGNLSQPQHSHFQGIHNAEHSGGLYGNPGGPPPVPMGTHPQHGHQHGPPQYGGPPQGGYDGQQGRW